jgi:hypothetical protein
MRTHSNGRITWIVRTQLRRRTGISTAWSLKVMWHEITKLEVASKYMPVCFVGVMKSEVRTGIFRVAWCLGCISSFLLRIFCLFATTNP